MLSIFGGKITTYRRLAEHALRELRRICPALGRPWTAGAPLPGGDLAEAISTPSAPTSCANGRGFPPSSRGVWPAPTARASSGCSATRPASTDLGRDLGARA